jgi:hypothetical protein
MTGWKDGGMEGCRDGRMECPYFTIDQIYVLFGLI